MIRELEVKDMPSVLRMLSDFAREEYNHEIDEEAFVRMIAGLYNTGAGAVFVLERDGAVHGMAGVVAHPRFYNPALMMAQELFWWVDPEFRGGRDSIRLLSALEDWVASRGVTDFIVACVGDERADRMSRFYSKMGYTAHERKFKKELSWNPSSRH